MDSVSNQVTKLASNASPAERKKILNTLDDLYQEVETPENARFRLQTRACQPHPLHLPLKVFCTYMLTCHTREQVLQGAMLATADDLRIFHRLSESETPLTTSQLAEKSGASPALLSKAYSYSGSFFSHPERETTPGVKRDYRLTASLVRVLRYLASCRFIEQLDENTFAAKRLTKTLGTDEFHGDLQL